MGRGTLPRPCPHGTLNNQMGEAMRLVAWNCNGGYHRKAGAIAALAPDIAVISECAQPMLLAQRGWRDFDPSSVIWVGTNPNKGLAVFAATGWRLSLIDGWAPTLRHIAPVRIEGPNCFNLLAVWAQNASGGISRKHQLGPLRRALSHYRDFLAAAPSVLAGDFNNNRVWDRPGWRINHMAMVEKARALRLESAYHYLTGEAEGAETQPTHYWRDRRKDGPTYHIDYVFAPRDWLSGASEIEIGSFEDWCGNGLSDHVPVTIDVDPG